jgi:radical SAM superfamily enzyme with C-terminal helix-hairpin-helix motif
MILADSVLPEALGPTRINIRDHLPYESKTLYHRENTRATENRKISLHFQHNTIAPLHIDRKWSIMKNTSKDTKGGKQIDLINHEE